jgi:putative SOS response-associated peptidase YedK
MTREAFQQAQAEFEKVKKEWGEYEYHDGMDPVLHQKAYQGWIDAKKTFAEAQDAYEAELETAESAKFLSIPERERS